MKICPVELANRATKAKAVAHIRNILEVYRHQHFGVSKRQEDLLEEYATKLRAYHESHIPNLIRLFTTKMEE